MASKKERIAKQIEEINKEFERDSGKFADTGLGTFVLDRERQNRDKRIKEVEELGKFKVGPGAIGAVRAQQIASSGREKAAGKIGSARRTRSLRQNVGAAFGAIGGFFTGGPAGAVTGAGLGRQIGGATSGVGSQVNQTQSFEQPSNQSSLSSQLNQAGFQPMQNSLGSQIQQVPGQMPLDSFQIAMLRAQQLQGGQQGGGFVG